MWQEAHVGSLTCASNCSGHGICRQGVCECSVGWGGLDCGTLDASACPNACSAHGHCRPGRTCACERGFHGDACEHGDPFGAVSTNEVPDLLE